jgi:hypothetical protein
VGTARRVGGGEAGDAGAGEPGSRLRCGHASPWNSAIARSTFSSSGSITL